MRSMHNFTRRTTDSFAADRHCRRHRSHRIVTKLLAIGVLLGQAAAIIAAEPRTLDDRLLHLRNGESREWADFAESPDADSLTVAFQAEANAAEQTLRLRQQDVKQAWRVELNGQPLGQLERDENDMIVYFAIPASRLLDGENILTVSTTAKDADDIRVGQIQLDTRPREQVLRESRLTVAVTDADRNHPLPCRITVVNADGSLQSFGDESHDQLAIRPGVIYSGNGSATVNLPAGDYTVYAGRGFEYGVSSTRLTIKPDDSPTIKLAIRREVDTTGWISCDTHVHTLTHSGHGDATIDERMLTIAGEGIELPIATDHNKHIDYEPVARQLGVRQHFTPVIGNEVTTALGHFNIFPVPASAPPPDFRPRDWPTIFDNIQQTPGVRAVILNHARDIHSGFRPFDPRHHIALTGENADGWRLRANAMEVLNSSAQQTDVMRLFHDWMGLLNHGHRITPVGCSDSHDVARHFIGQGRTYIRANDADPGRIDTAAAIESFVAGRVMVSLGLLAELTVNDRFGPGDLATASDTVRVHVRVLGPRWATADHVALYMNGQLVREVAIATDIGDSAAAASAGVKWTGEWTLPSLTHDVHLVAIA
ncbi:MAG: PHP domain-containing protein, partial [Planctomycetales bacterium]|nr:PHP domain-containing protein [Planctomycetales bacterium]